MTASNTTFDTLQNLLTQKAKIQNALQNDEALLKRIPSTMERRKQELAQVDAQLLELRKHLDQPKK